MENKMDQDVFNIQLRKFLKNVGITSQREIEVAVNKAIESGTLKATKSISARVELTIPELSLKTNINGEIRLS